MDDREAAGAGHGRWMHTTKEGFTWLVPEEGYVMNENPTDTGIGDWVRFYQNGRLVIGVVMYRTEAQWSCEPEFCTDVGTVAVKNVLETRKKRIE